MQWSRLVESQAVVILECVMFNIVQFRGSGNNPISLRSPDNPDFPRFASTVRGAQTAAAGA